MLYVPPGHCGHAATPPIEKKPGLQDKQVDADAPAIGLNCPEAQASQLEAPGVGPK